MSEFIRTQTVDHIASIGLDRGKSNAMHLEMVQELCTELGRAKDDPSVEAVIIHGKEGFFSSGLDLISLYDYDADKMRRFWEAFMELIYTLASLPKPTIASITGHSPAGGCVLAICCDYRIMADGDYIIGLNEVPVGITVPSSIFELYSFWLGEATAYRNLLEGKLYQPSEALTSGLIDEAVPLERIQTAASRKAKSWTQFDRHAWGTTKLNLRSALLQKIRDNKTQAITQVLEQWWRPSTRQILKTIIDNLTKKKE
ncbi:enoyl-CoA hydratase/carnithine racemase [Sphingobacterium allocomposti]|uniref:Enoyl-CoA hydratase/carnithine racemase n=1 Tax=Sphingobacterium allocomposti TaxID=415956 RepID=A0A5S5DAK8_9SPHI|nr:enoyl-CoA hydratase/isomerase family protein [Sphingobacterium composti Yoo et al. 2007 non Ten et al. 2007]TYP91782.1 enoyl-CoA hydratase/carnithine racemase [Sphingobacterium composti Yoo et al. 2007 non Ten et al. 2007]